MPIPRVRSPVSSEDRSADDTRPGSLAGKAVFRTSLAAAVVIAAMTVAVYFSVRRDAYESSIEALRTYGDERAMRESQLFANVFGFQATARTAFFDRLHALEDDPGVDALFDALFPLAPDGTRRSRDDLFDGADLGGGDYVSGIGAFIGEPDDLSPRDKRILLAAFRVVKEFGPPAFSFIDNFYFYTPGNRLIIYAPTRDDRLVFYRRTAPPDFNFRDEDFVRNTLVENNLERATSCTALRSIVYDQSRRTLTTGCQTPLDIDGEQVGAFGNSVMLNELLARAVANAPGGGHIFILAPDASLIAHPLQNGTETNDALSETFRNDSLYRRLVAATPQTGSAVVDMGGGFLYSLAHVEGPGWTFVTALSKEMIEARAARTSAILIIIGIFAIGLLSALVAFVIRRNVSEPLTRLTMATETLGNLGDGPEIVTARLALPLERDDEIGGLALNFDRMARRLSELFRTLEDKVRQRTVELEAALGAARRANEAKSVFLANISHEVRTPMTGVMGMLRLMLEGHLDGEQREYARAAHQSAENLLVILNDILDSSKLEAGALRLEAVSCEPKALIEDVVALLRPKALEKDIRIETAIGDTVPAAILADPVRLRQILFNLIGNAIKFTRRGRIDVRLEGKMRHDGMASLLFEVEDEGIGIPEAAQARLFQRFMQADDSTTRRFGGTGLGLSICRELVTLMDGEIGVRSVEGKGSTFWFTILVPVTEPQKRQDPSDETQSADAPKAPLSILVADDSKVNRMLIARMLEKSGHHVELAEDGEQAVLKAGAGSYDVILMDMQMPVIDGLAATRTIRQRLADRSPVIIALTANAMAGDREKYLAAGLDDHIGKPIDWQALRRSLDSLARGMRREKGEENPSVTP